MVKIAGIYSATVHLTSPNNNQAKVAMFVNRADGSGEERLCDAHTLSGTCRSKLLSAKVYSMGFNGQPRDHSTPALHCSTLVIFSNES